MEFADACAASTAGRRNAEKLGTFCNISKEPPQDLIPYQDQKSLFAFPFNPRLACHAPDDMCCQFYRVLAYKHNRIDMNVHVIAQLQ